VADAAPALEVPPFSVVATGYQFVEGPRVAADGTLWFSDLLAGGYHRIAPDGTASAFATGRQWIDEDALAELAKIRNFDHYWCEGKAPENPVYIDQW